jgi:6-phosphogluconolactonase (cycloisomerase 2 family)
VSFYDNDQVSGVDTFKRNTSNGKLTFVSAVRDDPPDVAIGGAWRIAISPDDKSLYTANYSDNSVALFRRAK